jgi:hypothetical protein
MYLRRARYRAVSFPFDLSLFCGLLITVLRLKKRRLVPLFGARAQRCLISGILDSQELLRLLIVLAFHVDWLRSLNFRRKYIREGVERFYTSLAIFWRKHLVSLPFANLFLGCTRLESLELRWNLVTIRVRVLAPSSLTGRPSIFYLVDVLFNAIIVLGFDSILNPLLDHFLLIRLGLLFEHFLELYLLSWLWTQLAPPLRTLIALEMC